MTKIRVMRIKNAYTVKEAALLIGIAPDTLRRIEIGKANISPRVLLQACALYECRPYDIHEHCTKL